MTTRRRTGRKLVTALLPIALAAAAALAGLTVWLVAGALHPPRQQYLVTPEKFAQLSDRGLRATEETWPNPDGTSARGWLLRGEGGAPAVLLLHRYGADRSWLLNLGVKINETTNMTVLLPDLRGHGDNPAVPLTGFGPAEGADALAAIRFLRTLKSNQGGPLAGEVFGVYGVGLGAYAGLAAAAREPAVRALALDSVPAAPDETVRGAVEETAGFDNPLFRWLARQSVRVYFGGSYDNTPACRLAADLRVAKVLLLSGESAGPLKGSTEALAACFPAAQQVTALTNLPLTGNTSASATPEQGEIYDRRVVEFFDDALRAGR